MNGRSRLHAIIGCGRFGGHLAGHLARKDYDVVVIDADERAFDKLPLQFGGFRVTGDATRMETLRQAGVERAAVAVVATRDDNVNMMVAQVVRRVLGVPRVIARVFDPAREALYHGLEVETICPTLVAASECFALLAKPETARRSAS